MTLELIQELQYITSLKFLNIALEKHDIYTLYQIIDNIIITINSIIPDCQLDKDLINIEFNSDYIFLISKENINVLNGKVSIFLSLNDFNIANVEVSILH